MKKNFPYVSAVLVAVNVLLFLICTFTGNVLYNIGGLSPAHLLREGQFYRIFFAMFLHADIYHLMNNMLLLAGLGAMIEKETGHILFLLLYFLAGAGGQAVSLVYKISKGEWSVVSIGASGAVFGLVGVLLAMAVFFAGELENVTWQRVLIMAMYSIYSGVRAANIDNAAHVGGFLVGLLCGVIMCMFKKLSNNRRNSNDYGGGK